MSMKNKPYLPALFLLLLALFLLLLVNVAEAINTTPLVATGEVSESELTAGMPVNRNNYSNLIKCISTS